jgi:hypothetical protein
MADAKFSIALVNIASNLRIIARETTSPLIEVYNQIIVNPSSNVNVVVTGLRPVPHYFDFYETTATSGASPLGTKRSTFYQDLSLSLDFNLKFIEFTVDVDGPSNGDTQYINTDLNDIDTDNIQVSQRSIGFRSWGSEIQAIAGGGFELLGGELFNGLDKWFITYQVKTVNSQPIMVANKFADVKFFASTISLNSTHYNTLILDSGNVRGWQDMYMPLQTQIPNYTTFTINLVGSNVKGLTIYNNNGTFRGINGNVFYLRKGEWITFMSYANELIIIDGKGNWDKVGEQIIKEQHQSNTVDEYSIKEWGQTVNVDDEKRFFYWFVNRLNPSYLATNVNNQNEKGKFFIFNGAIQFRMPDSTSRNNQGIGQGNSTPGTFVYLRANLLPPDSSFLIQTLQHFSRIL